MNMVCVKSMAADGDDKLPAKSVTINNCSYRLYIDSITNERCAEFWGGEGTVIKIPRKIKYEKNDYIVRGIGGTASKDVVTVKIPNTVYYICDCAFMGKLNLANMEFEKGSQLKEIRESAFYGCENLRTFPLFEHLETIGIQAFAKSGITGFQINKNMKEIKQWAFKDCKSLRYITSEAGNVIKIGIGAFENSSLTKAEFGDIEKISNSAFKNCSNLQSVFYENLSCHEIPTMAFQGCKLLQRFMEAGIYALDKEEYVTFMGNIGFSAFNGCESIKKVRKAISLSSGIKTDSIYENAFMGCKSLRDVFILDTLEYVGYNAFSRCVSLPDISINSSYLGNSVFDSCTSLKKVYINVPCHIDDFCFRKCESLTNVYTKGPNSYGSDVFYGCNNLESVAGLSADDNFSQDISSLFDKTKFDYRKLKYSYKYYLKSNITNTIEKWQQKKEYETVADWQNRVTEANRDAKVAALKDSLRSQYIKRYSPKELGAKIVSYDADAGVYKIQLEKVNRYTYYNYDIKSIMDYCPSDVYAFAKVPRGEAEAFKANWDKVKINPTYCISKDYLGIASCIFSVNGKKYTSPTLYDDETANVDLKLSPLDIDLGGKNNVAKVKYDDTLDKNVPRTSVKNDKTFAVIIGNENYQKVTKVDFAQNDANTFADYCQKTLGLPQKNVRVYKDATYGMMIGALGDIKNIAAAYNGDINIIFYYAGHGIPNESTNDAFLLPVDADGKQADICYPLARLYTELGEMRTHSVTVFMDACFSGSERGKGMLMAARGVAIKAKPAAPQGNMVIFSAASGDETAYPYKEKGHGLMTYYLLKKLQETKGDVTLGELGRYIVDNVTKESVVSNGKSQTPTVVPSDNIINGWENMKLR